MTSIKDQIRKNIIDTLKGVQAIAGYDNSAEVEEINQDENAFNVPRDGLVIVSEDPAGESADEAPLGADAFFQRYLVTCFVVGSNTDGGTSTRARSESIAADVVKILSIDRKRGNLAIWTDFEPHAIESQGQPRW